MSTAAQGRLGHLDEFRALLFSHRELNLRDRGWLLPLIVTAIGGLIRLIGLNHPSTLAFDETYYVKDAYTYWELGYDAQWPEKIDDQFAAGSPDLYSEKAAYTVHPPVGKWIIGLGIKLGGVENPWAWRIATALLGTIAILILARTARRLLSSTRLGALAGGLLAIDGLGIVMSRIALLDGVLMFFVVVAFGCVVADRTDSRRRLALAAARAADEGRPPIRLRTGIRWWRIGTVVALGLAMGTKWSGLYFVIAFGALMVCWDLSARRAIARSGIGPRPSGGRAVPVSKKDESSAALDDTATDAAALAATASDEFPAESGDNPDTDHDDPATGDSSSPLPWVRDWLLRDVARAVPLGLLAVVVYVATWWKWFTHLGAWGRTWAAGHPEAYPSLLPDALHGWWDGARSFIHYHSTMLEFHSHLDSAHQYMSNPWLWPIQYRPTSFFWEDTDISCFGDDKCIEAITALGNPVLWWVGTAAMIFALWRLVTRHDWRAGAVIAGYFGAWVPWLFFAHRTIFNFYMVVLSPFVALAVAYAAAVLLERTEVSASLVERANEDGELTRAKLAARRLVRRSRRGRRNTTWAVAAIIAAIVAVSVFFLPLWTGMPVPYLFWLVHMWSASWI
ncbi:dolichyl-phosphate-mannose--protein mannosyltransferase [Rarobacter faecitabidus]|uniref:Polyprenol-phosphate-mannose--protein mannosyltransferase n=1 Tax=Rarobacter faecitabidus TaxID=13243 RepID=A0A542ZTV6_RARFA|nr:phospholipid carrier-dependent glycosyltransferase [Rarobacter faecitabidus]TQL63794.1 protein-O-mannosyltransferase-like protein [Rarobacter faecitabidus]